MSTLVHPLMCILVAVFRANVMRNEEIVIFREELDYNAYQYTETTSKYGSLNRVK